MIWYHTYLVWPLFILWFYSLPYISMLLYEFLSVCVYACSMYNRTIALFELMFLLTKPTLNKVYSTLHYFTLLYPVMAAILLLGRHIGITVILELPPSWIWYYISRLFVNEYDHGFSLTSLQSPFISDNRKYAFQITTLLHFYFVIVVMIFVYTSTLVDMYILWRALVSPLFIDGNVLTKTIMIDS